MKILNRKRIIIILITIILFYIIISGIIIVNVQFLQSPDIYIKVDFKEINSDNAIIVSEIEIDNPNNFDLISKNLEIISTTSDGYEIARVFLEGGAIQAHKKKIFTENISVSFNGTDPGLIKIKLTGEVGASILFIEKLSPISIGVVSSLENIIDNLAAPSISLYTEIIDVSTDSIFIDATVNAYNPNTFEMYVDDVSAVIETETGKKVGEMIIPSGYISAKESLKLNSSGSILFEALNAKTLFFKINGNAGGRLAGIDKSIPFNIEAQIKVPSLEELFLSKDPTIFSTKVDRKITLKGALNTIIMQINNTNKLDVVLKDVICSVYVDVNEKSYFMGSNKIDEDVIAKAKEVTNFSTSILTKWSYVLPVLFKVIRSDWYVVVVQAKITVRGVNQAAFIEIRGYDDQHKIG